MLSNTMKIKSWVPQAINNPMPPTFGDTDALRGSSVEITKITGNRSYPNPSIARVGTEPPGQASALQGACRRSLSFCLSVCGFVALWLCGFVGPQKMFFKCPHNLLKGGI